MTDKLLKHKLYRPIQVAIRPSDYSKIVYREYPPARALQNYVYCYWTAQAKAQNSKPFLYRIMVDGCIDLMLNCSIEYRLRFTDSVDKRIKIANAALLGYLKVSKREPDQWLLTALDIIYQRKGQLSVEKDVLIGIGSRHLRRIFNHYIGISPKKFSKIVRFQSILRHMMSNPNNFSKGGYLDFGYFDQPHFIHEFKSLSGVTPSFLKQH